MAIYSFPTQWLVGKELCKGVEDHIFTINRITGQNWTIFGRRSHRRDSVWKWDLIGWELLRKKKSKKTFQHTSIHFYETSSVLKFLTLPPSSCDPEWSICSLACASQSARTAKTILLQHAGRANTYTKQRHTGIQLYWSLGKQGYIYIYQPPQCKTLLHWIGGIQRPPAATADKGAGKNPQRSNALRASLTCLNCITERLSEMLEIISSQVFTGSGKPNGSIRVNLLMFNIVNFYKTAISPTPHWFSLLPLALSV